MASGISMARCIVLFDFVIIMTFDNHRTQPQSMETRRSSETSRSHWSRHRSLDTHHCRLVFHKQFRITSEMDPGRVALHQEASLQGLKNRPLALSVYRSNDKNGNLASVFLHNLSYVKLVQIEGGRPCFVMTIFESL
jgi:hypothetical protein